MKRVALLSILLCSGSDCLFGQVTAAAAVGPGPRPCSLLDRSADPAEAVTAADLFRAYSTQANLVRTLHIVGSMSGTGYGVVHEPATLVALIDLAQPDMIRITGILQYRGSRAVELTSDGHQFGLLIPEGNGKVFLTGPIDAPPRSTVAGENLRPRPFIEALRWVQGTPRSTTAAGPATAPEKRVLTIDVASTEITPSRKIDVIFDLASGVVDSLTAYDSSGERIFEVRYSDWRTDTGPSSGVPAECFARYIVLDELQQDYQIDLRISDVTLNAMIPRSNFRPTPPRGIPIKQLDMAGGRSAQ